MNMKSLAFLCSLIFGVLFIPHQDVLATETLTMPVQATLLQCGKKADIKKSCQNDSRCCVFLDGSLRDVQVASVDGQSQSSDLVFLGFKYNSEFGYFSE